MEIRKKKSNTFVFFKDFLRRMQNKVYFTEVKPGVYKRDSKFKLKTDFVVHTQFKKIDAFGWRVRERINSVIESMKNEKSSQNISNKEKTALRNLIKTKNEKIVINDTDKNMGCAHADKSDVIFECIRQLGDVKTYSKRSEAEIKNIISEI